VQGGGEPTAKPDDVGFPRCGDGLSGHGSAPSLAVRERLSYVINGYHIPYMIILSRGFLHVC
jgi:hypothetical protein